MSSYSCCNTKSIKSNQVGSLSSLLQLVGEKSRLQILCILKNGTHCVCELMEHVPLSQSLISHHLRDLKDTGLISDEKKGLNVYYSLTDKGKKIVRSIFSLVKIKV